MSCSTCAAIPDIATANTGREQYFGAPMTSLARLSIERDDDLWECPECAALFHWHDDRSWTGSGNNDEEVLLRLPAEQASLVRAYVRRGDRPASEVAATAQQLLALPDVLRDLVGSHVLRHDRELARALVPRMLDKVEHGRDWPFGFVRRFASGKDASLVSAALSGRPRAPALDELRVHCIRSTCSTCSTIASYPRQTARIDAPLPIPLASLVRLGASKELDVWECPECASMFLWESADGREGTLSRLLDFAADALRSCVHREGVVSELAQELVFASDAKRDLKLVFAHGLQSDRELIRQLVPRAIVELARIGQPWLRDRLCEFACEPSDAAFVLEAITKSSRTSASIEALAACCRRVIG